jgi:hypothetical protein
MEEKYSGRDSIMAIANNTLVFANTARLKEIKEIFISCIFGCTYGYNFVPNGSHIELVDNNK